MTRLARNLRAEPRKPRRKSRHPRCPTRNFLRGLSVKWISMKQDQETTMSDSTKKPDQQAIDRAIATDLYNNDMQALKDLSPARLQIVEQAIADHKKQTTDHSERDWERKVARMSTKELEQMMRDGDDQKRRNG